MGQYLPYGAISAFEGSISLEFRAVEARDASKLISNPEKFLGVVERKCCYGGWNVPWRGWWKEQAPDLEALILVFHCSV
jgi:hypothetical protein